MFRVMLVEDDAKLAALVTEYLAAYEFSVHVLARGDQAVPAPTDTPPNVVVVDGLLPGFSIASKYLARALR